ncbi:fimbrial protein [Salmonella enterica subsp. houtenae serovar 44:z36,[z38]:-]|uniref:Fimbrial protein n=1 Tax=Salmonella enterica subsp. houtenae serovar 44:z36[z38]:- TaxID=1967609 RepID=A0A736I6N2_SALHO|nr:hypothetical protein [Salmonella enterica]ECZ5471583.1 fimbrial protein [Salmonella enterica subsp. houtenae]EDP9795110.1 fimbrial protein [Salmonella enterica subsp. salamae]EHM8759205.1 fimbrial protein [Salmonella enterica subsp. houtenae serovar 44:z36,[z38]:-]HAE7581362.1 fimbrial protein [Salmonella enterica subsp. houtenae serovar 44:z36[z38]:-]HCM1978832.1 fimbrial protein [Salmonella enterica subsp. houtenae serovar 47:z36:-]HCM6269223.1 fimbrial protein [Salmonella enterica subsp
MKVLTLLLPLWGSVLLVPGVVLAGSSFGSSQVGGTLTADITMTIRTPSCTLDSAVETVDFQTTETAALRNGSRSKSVTATLRCDSVPSALTLVLEPVGSSQVNNVVAPGVITTSLDNTGYKLTWATGSAVGTPGVPVEYQTELPVLPKLNTGIAIMVTPVALGDGRIPSGEATAQIRLRLTYS